MAGLLVTQITVNVASVNRETMAGSLQIQDQINGRSTASFTVRDTANALSFQKGQPVTITDTLNSKTLFGGWVDRVTRTAVQNTASPFAVYMFHQLSCVDHHYLADKRLVIKKYVNLTAGAIVNDLITSYLTEEGVTTSAGDVEAGPVIKEASFGYATVAACLDALAEHAGFWWRIDGDKHLRFKAPTTEAAPFTISRTTTMADGLQIEQGNALYRNVEYVTGISDVTIAQHELRQGDGTTRSWSMAFPLANVPSVAVDGVRQTVGVRGTDTGKQFYWAKGDNAITQDDSESVLVSPQILNVNYVGQGNFVIFTSDPTGISARAAIETGTSGKVEVADPAFDVQDASNAIDMATQKLAKYNDIGSILSATTRTTGLLPGQQATVNFPEWGVTNIPMLIESVTLADRGKEIWFSVRAFEGTPEGDWALAFARAITPKGVDLLTLGDSILLAPVVGESSSWGWTESAVTQTATTCTFPGAAVTPGAITLC